MLQSFCRGEEKNAGNPGDTNGIWMKMTEFLADIFYIASVWNEKTWDPPNGPKENHHLQKCLQKG